MSQPIIIIELFENQFEALYSNTDLTFIIVNRTEDEYESNVYGPYKPTLETDDLAHVIDGIELPEQLLTSSPAGPYFCSDPSDDHFTPPEEEEECQ